MPTVAQKTARGARSSALLRQLPSVDEILRLPETAELIEKAGRQVVVDTIRDTLAALRKSASNGALLQTELPRIASAVAERIQQALSPSLQPVINATGVVLHTNLGRAPLSNAAVQRIAVTASRYSNLEYDLAAGQRGKRDTHTSRLLAETTGAEAAIVVNNNAAAVFLVLNTLAKDGEVVVSRGELIEIGDGFRIPEIMSASGARLREVGTTNRTRIADYQRAIGKETRLLLRVHPSNFKIVGFTNRPELKELVALGRKKRIPVYEDLGSGCLAYLSAVGVAEPVVRDSLAAGADIVSFSGDKLLGGPQAGIIAGKRKLVERIRRNPLFRALRVDKLTIAALTATLSAYHRGALDDVPALRMIRMGAAEIERRSRAFTEKLRAQVSREVSIELRDGLSVIGGGSTPDQKLPTKLVVIRGDRCSAAELEERLRKPQTGALVIARIEKNTLVIDLRTVFPEEEEALAAALTAALA